MPSQNKPAALPSAMSLKHFHIVFLAIAMLCDAGIWLWMHLAPDDAAMSGALPLKPYVGLICIGLLAYGIWYTAKKMRTIIV